MIGNFMADHIKGTSIPTSLHPAVQRGIVLHRAIDTFTDAHPLVIQAKRSLYDTQGKYAPVVLDILFDHLLALNWERYNAKDLRAFSQIAYEQFLNYGEEPMPPKLWERIQVMIEHDWLMSFQTPAGLHESFRLLKRRLKFDSRVEFAVDDLYKDFDFFNDVFQQFYPALYEHAVEHLELG